MLLSINVFGKEIPMYGLLCIVGILISLVIACLLAKKKHIDLFDFVLSAVFALFGAWLGAKLLFVIVSWDDVVLLFSTYSALTAIEVIIRSGYVFYGGLIGGFLSLIISLKIQKKDILGYLSIYAVVLPLGHAFGRIGCFVSGCCYGVHYDGLFSCVYERSMDGNTPLNTPLLPIQLIEAFLLVMLFGVLIFYYLKCKNIKNIPILYAVSYSIIRFILEFFRGDYTRGVYFGLSTSQWISVFIVMVVICAMVISKMESKRIKI